MSEFINSNESFLSSREPIRNNNLRKESAVGGFFHSEPITIPRVSQDLETGEEVVLGEITLPHGLTVHAMDSF